MALSAQDQLRLETCGMLSWHIYLSQSLTHHEAPSLGLAPCLELAIFGTHCMLPATAMGPEEWSHGKLLSATTQGTCSIFAAVPLGHSAVFYFYHYNTNNQIKEATHCVIAFCRSILETNSTSLEHSFVSFFLYKCLYFYREKQSEILPISSIHLKFQYLSWM